MSDREAVYDLGEVLSVREAAARSTWRPKLRDASARRSGTGRTSARPNVAASLSLVLPGAGHLVALEASTAIFFCSWLALVGVLGWALWETRARIVPTLAVLELPAWALAAAFGTLYAAAATLHVWGVLDAQRASASAAGKPKPVHPIVAALASAAIPGWGQVLATHRVRAALFLLSLWTVGAAWLLALADTRRNLERLGVPVPDRLIDAWGPTVLLSATGVVWALAIWDAAWGASQARRA